MLDPNKDQYAVDPLVDRLIATTNLCMTFNQLPRPGGVLDQDALTMIGMQMVLDAQEEKRKLEENRNKRGRNR